jgi:hypothetical protein
MWARGDDESRRDEGYCTMTNTKLGLAAMVAAVLTFGVAACGPQAETTPEAAPEVAAPEVVEPAPVVEAPAVDPAATTTEAPATTETAPATTETK